MADGDSFDGLVAKWLKRSQKLKFTKLFITNRTALSIASVWSCLKGWNTPTTTGWVRCSAPLILCMIDKMLEPFQRSVIAIVTSFSFANQDVAIQIVVMTHLCKSLTAQANNRLNTFSWGDVLSCDSQDRDLVPYPHILINQPPSTRPHQPGLIN